jgi:hypothetical protein
MKDKKVIKIDPNKSLEQDKLDLIKLRIKNKFYNKEDVLERVASEIVKHEIKEK